MIKIKWTDKRRFVPRIGNLEYGQEAIIPEEIAKALIAQGQAEEVLAEKKQKPKEKD